MNESKHRAIYRGRPGVALMGLILVAALGGAPAAFAQQSLPEFEIPYQGLIASNAANRVPATAKLTFRLYTDAIQGTAVWGEDHANVAIDTAMGGRFNVLLGDGTNLAHLDDWDATLPQPAFFTPSPELIEVLVGSQLFLEIQVDANKPLFPRQQLLYTPYAVFAFRADSAEVADSFAGSVAGGSYPPGVVVPYAGLSVDPADKNIELIPPGWVLCDGRTLKRADEPALFGVIGTVYNFGSTPADSFRLPDYRGYFLRGANNGRTGDFADTITPRIGNSFSIPGDGIGKTQEDDLHEHDHRALSSEIDPTKSASLDPDNPNFEMTANVDQGTVVFEQDDAGIGRVNLTIAKKMTEGNGLRGLETRPDNAAVFFIIKK